MAPTTEVTTRSSTKASAIDPEQTLKASKALLAHIKKAAAEKEAAADKKTLLGGDDDEVPIWLQMTTKRHIAATNHLKPGKIYLPHSINTNEHISICLIAADHTKDQIKAAIESEDFPKTVRVEKVIEFTSLSKKYNQYEAQRKLFAEYDIFLGDDRIINRLPKVLGKTFYKSMAKRPIPVDLQSRAKTPKPAAGQKPNRSKGHENLASTKHIASEVEKAIHSTYVNLSPSTNVAVKIGLASMEPAQLSENVAAVADALITRWIPQSWKNVKAVFIKSPESVALPIWQTDELFVDAKDVAAPVTEEEKKALKEEKKKALKEKPNVGKKRKSISNDKEEAEAATTEDSAEKQEKPSKKSKKAKAAPAEPAVDAADAAVAESNDAALDKQISERKDKLKKAKAKARKSLD